MCLCFSEPQLQRRGEWHLDMKLVTLGLSLWWNRVFPFGNHCSKNGKSVWPFCWTELQPKGISLGALLQPSPWPLGSVCLIFAQFWRWGHHHHPLYSGHHPQGTEKQKGRRWTWCPSRREQRGAKDRARKSHRARKGARCCSWNRRLDRPRSARGSRRGGHIDKLTVKQRRQMKQECVWEAGQTERICREEGLS